VRAIHASPDNTRHTAQALPGQTPICTAHGGGADNCYKDYAQTNAQDLMDLLTAIDAEVDRPEM